MAGLQRSSISFRRQGSSGLVWNDKLSSSGESSNSNRRPQDRRFLSGELQIRRGHVAGEITQQGETTMNLRPIRTTTRSASDNNRPRPSATGEVPSARGAGAASQLPNRDPPSPKLLSCGCCGGIVKSPRSSRKPRAR